MKKIFKIRKPTNLFLILKILCALIAALSFSLIIAGSVGYLAKDGSDNLLNYWLSKHPGTNSLWYPLWSTWFLIGTICGVYIPVGSYRAAQRALNNLVRSERLSGEELSVYLTALRMSEEANGKLIPIEKQVKHLLSQEDVSEKSLASVDSITKALSEEVEVELTERQKKLIQAVYSRYKLSRNVFLSKLESIRTELKQQKDDIKKLQEMSMEDSKKLGKEI